MTAAELREAAALLRAAATAATPGPWTSVLLPANEHHRHPAHWVTTRYRDRDGEVSETVANCPWRQADADLIALLGPPTVLALADWLDDAAADYDAVEVAAATVWPDSPEQQDRWIAEHQPVPALALARLINREEASDAAV